MTKLQLVTIGNELLNGKIQDLNASWLAKFCYEHNVELQKVQIIGDNDSDFESALKVSIQEADIILTSGGLGPTKDDMTKRMLAKFFNKEISHNKKAWSITNSHYDRFGRELIKENVDYGNFPKDFIPFYNPVGFAPGLGFITEDKKIIASMPGVPSEFQAMFKEEVFPYIQKNILTNEQLFKHVIIKTHKLHESKIFSETAPGLWESLEMIGEVSSLPHSCGVDIGVKVQGNTLNELEKKEHDVIQKIKATKLVDYIWHIGPESIEEVIIEKAKEKGLTIGFAESCTGGLLAHRITNVSGSSSVFWGSVISYSNEVKRKVLNVKQTTLDQYGAVSLNTAEEMAKGALKALNVDIAVSTTGIAGPLGGSPEKPVGTVGIGFATKVMSGSKMFQFHGDRDSLKHSFSQRALFTMLSQLN